jgi:acetylornithine/succinyldiaminopimelate/putrescine aminotransferase
MLSTREIFLSSLAQTSAEPLLLEIESAHGLELYTPDGRVILDMISGISVSNLGHSHPHVVKAVQDQASRHMHLMVYGELIQSPQTALAAKLCSLLPPSLNNIYFVNSGSEAVEGALKIARKYTGRQKMVAFNNAYHGSTMGALSMMGCEAYRDAFQPLLPGVNHLEFMSPVDLDQITEETACVLVEPVQGEAGIRIPDAAYLQALRKRCNETGSLLIFDEIQTGLGRTGTMFRFEQTGVVPDIILLAKALGAGMPLGAFIAGREIMHVIMDKPILGHITTFGGHPVSCAAALAGLEVMESENIIKQTEAKGSLFEELLSQLNGIKEIRRAGLMMALDFGNAEKVQRIIRRCLDKGILLDWFLFDPQSVRIAPPLVISEEQIRKCCAVISECCA